MDFNLILFYVFAAIAVGTTLLVVVQSNPVYSVLLLIGSFVGLAGLYVLRVREPQVEPVAAAAMK